MFVTESNIAERAVVLSNFNLPAMKDISNQLATAGFKPAAGKIVKVRPILEHENENNM